MSALPPFPGAGYPDASLLAPAQDVGAKQKRTRKVKSTKVVDGIEQEVEIEVEDSGGPEWGPRESLKVLDKELQRVDGPVKVSGRATYTHDVRVPGMAWARLLLAPVASLKVARLDFSACKAVKGYLGHEVIEAEETRWLGQPIAAVAAETSEAAEDCLRAIVFEWEARPSVLDREAALKPDAPQVSRRGNQGKPAVRGDEAKARAAIEGAPHKVSATYVVPVVHHACLETHGAVVDWRGGEEAVVHCSSQHTFGFAGDAAEVLGLKKGNVVGLVEHMGGGFGSKFGFGQEGEAAARLSKALRRPVHLMLTRKDEFRMAGNRSGSHIEASAGMDAAGRLVGFAARAHKHGGIGDGSLSGLPYIYKCAESWSEISGVRTNLDASRAMRAPGHPQASFATESLIDELAYAAGLDLLEVRKANLDDQVWHRQLERVAREVGWFEHPHRARPGSAKDELCVGIGFAISRWGGGGGPSCEVEIAIERDGSVVSSVGSQDLGTGVRTYVAAIPAEELGLPLSAVVARIGSTRLGNANGSGGSVTTASLAPAVKHAAWNARQAFAEVLAPLLGCQPPDVVFADGAVQAASGGRKLSWKQACAALPEAGLRAKGAWQAHLQANGVHGAQAAKVEVDTLTGRVRVLHMACMQDVGLCLNRAATRSQINGGMVQALGYALFEERVVDAALGIQLNPCFEDYKLPHSLEIPKMTVVLDDEDRRAPIGMSEAPIVPGGAAIANAIHNACGARIRSLPCTPDKVLAALGKVS